MKKYLVVLAALFGFVSLSQASVKAPVDSKGNTLPTMDFVGAQNCTMQNADSTTGKLCFTGAGMVYGVLIGSDSATNFVVFRDSATANTSSAITALVYATGATSTAGVQFKFPAPLAITNGLSLNANSAVASGGVWTILYRKLAAPEN